MLYQNLIFWRFSIVTRDWGLCVLVVPLICILISYNSRFISQMAFTAKVIGLKTNLDVELNPSRRSQIVCPELINHHR